jgi:hypothetical protein
LKHPFLYLNMTGSSLSPPCLLYRILCEQACKTPSLSKLHKQYMNLCDKEAAKLSHFYAALRTLQLCGQVGLNGSSSNSVTRLNLDDSLSLLDAYASELFA